MKRGTKEGTIGEEEVREEKEKINNHTPLQ